jgi:hypothetical protein
MAGRNSPRAAPVAERRVRKIESPSQAPCASNNNRAFSVCCYLQVWQRSPANSMSNSTDPPDTDPLSDSMPTSSYRPELPDWGVYLTWPLPGHAWIHAADLSRALMLIPSRRIFHRTRWDNTFYQLHYGSISIRVRPTMWVRVPSLDLSVGQQVELLSRQGQNEGGIFWIHEMLFNPRSQQAEFFLQRRGMIIPKSFTRQDLQPIQVQHRLRAGYYQHQPQRAQLPPDLELLDVGDLTSDEHSP